MLLPEMLQKLKMWIFLLYTYLYSPSVADEVSEEWWQLVTAIHDDVMFWYYEGDTHNVMTTLILGVFALVWPNWLNA